MVGNTLQAVAETVESANVGLEGVVAVTIHWVVHHHSLNEVVGEEVDFEA